MGPLDEWLTSRLIFAWRDQVWQDATGLVDLPFNDEGEAIRVEVQTRSLQRAAADMGQRYWKRKKCPA